METRGREQEQDICHRDFMQKIIESCATLFVKSQNYANGPKISKDYGHFS